MNSIKIEGFNPIELQKNEQIKPSKSSGFGDVIKNAIENVDKLEKAGDKSVLDLMQGKEDVHTTMIALQKSDISMRLILSVRNKVVEAYKEIMRMQF